MEAIPKEVIDMAEDFFSRLSHEERAKWLYEYFKEQSLMGAQFHLWFEKMADGRSLRTIVSLCLVIFRSYRYYGISLPQISIDAFTVAYTKYKADLDEIGSKGLGTVNTYLEVTKDIHQEEIVNYILLKLHGTEDNLVGYVTQADSGISTAIAFMTLILLNNETKKHFIN